MLIPITILALLPLAVLLAVLPPGFNACRRWGQKNPASKTSRFNSGKLLSLRTRSPFHQTRREILAKILKVNPMLK